MSNFSKELLSNLSHVNKYNVIRFYLYIFDKLKLLKLQINLLI